MPRKPAKTIEQLEAELAALEQALETARDARQERFEAWQAACRAAKEAGNPLPHLPHEDWADDRKLGRRRSAAKAALTRARRALDPAYQGGGKATLRVETAFGTFERRTDHEYTHLVLELIPAATQHDADDQLLAAIGDAYERAKYQLAMGVDAAGVYREPGRPGGYYPAATILRFDYETVEARVRCAAGYSDVWRAARWSHSLRGALAGRDEILRYHAARRTAIVEVATGKEVRG